MHLGPFTNPLGPIDVGTRGTPPPPPPPSNLGWANVSHISLKNSSNRLHKLVLGEGGEGQLSHLGR